MHLAYNGKNYHGWQIQNNGTTVQSILNSALSLILRTPVQVVGCGRTDTGVHAENFYAHFDLPPVNQLNSFDKLIGKLNNFLPKDIAIKRIFPVDLRMHARFSAISRTYEYRICTFKDPFLEELAFYFPRILNLQLMNNAACIIMQYSDFTSFAKLHAQTATNICKISRADWRMDNGLLVFTITADRFLRNMVRAITGTLLDVGLEKIDLDELRSIIENKCRSGAGTSLPAKGLFLTDVAYPEGSFTSL